MNDSNSEDRKVVIEEVEINEEVMLDDDGHGEEVHVESAEQSAIRWFAVAGFVVLVILLAYLAVQVVQFIPGVFSKLADVFEDNQRGLYAGVRGTNDDDTNDDKVATNDGDNDDGTPVSGNDDKETATSTPVKDGSKDDSVSKPSYTPPRPAPIQYRTVTTYKVPVSDPTGYTDLKATFVAIGRVTSDGRFTASNQLSSDEDGAVQFVVSNVGTKTSGEWYFTATLPNGAPFQSRVQRPLQPGERATLTVAFTMGDDAEDFTLNVNSVEDTNLANNGFRISTYTR